jgi:hypothetical protein
VGCSVPAGRHFRSPFLAMLVAMILLPYTCVQGDRSLEVIDPNPIAVEGDVLGFLVRCREDDPGRQLPTTLRLELDDGEEIVGYVGWIGWQASSFSPSDLADWTSPTISIQILDVPTTREDRARATAYVFCRLPSGYRGSFRMGRTDIRPRWLDAAPEPEGERMEPLVGAGWPSLTDPGAWWRWALLADKEGLVPPDPVGGEVEQLLSRYVAGLWRVGLARVRKESPGTASELLELLTARCTTDRQKLIATWITDTSELQSILDLMLDTRRSDSLVVRSVLSFLDARFPLLPWIELEMGTKVRIAIANPTDGEQVLRLQWLEGDPIPSAAVVPSGRVVEIELDRPVFKSFRSVVELQLAPPQNDLVLTVGRRQRQLRFSSDRLEVRPPGLQFGPFLAPLSLKAAWGGVLKFPPPNWATIAILRKRAGRWDLFLECFQALEREDGVDQVEIHLGPSGTPVRVIRIDSNGNLEFTPDGARFQGATARVKRFEDRWRAIVSLDPVLVAASGAPGESETLQVGFRRRFDGRLLSLAGSPLPPWNVSPPIYLLDLSKWGEILPSEGSGASGDDASVYLRP